MPAEIRNVTASMAMVAPGPMIAARNPASAGPDDPADVEHRLEDRVRPRDLRPADEPGHRRRVGGEPQHAQDVHREGHGEDHGERRAAERHRDRHEGGEEEPPEVGPEHHPATVPAVGVRAGRQADDEVGQGRQHAHDPHREPGPGQRQHEQRHRRVGDRIAERADPLAEQHGQEVAVVAQPGAGRVGGAVGGGREVDGHLLGAGRPGDHVARLGALLRRRHGSRVPFAIAARCRRHLYPPGVCRGRATLAVSMHPRERRQFHTMTDPTQPRGDDAPASTNGSASPFGGVKINFGADDGASPLATAQPLSAPFGGAISIIGDAGDAAAVPAPGGPDDGAAGPGRTHSQGPGHRQRSRRPDGRHLRGARQPRAHRHRRVGGRRPADAHERGRELPGLPRGHRRPRPDEPVPRAGRAVRHDAGRRRHRPCRLLRPPVPRLGARRRVPRRVGDRRDRRVGPVAGHRERAAPARPRRVGVRHVRRLLLPGPRDRRGRRRRLRDGGGELPHEVREQGPPPAPPRRPSAPRRS